MINEVSSCENEKGQILGVVGGRIVVPDVCSEGETREQSALRPVYCDHLFTAVPCPTAPPSIRPRYRKCPTNVGSIF